MEPDDHGDPAGDASPDWAPPDPSSERSLTELPYHEMIATYEDRLAEQRRSSIEAGRRKAGAAGAALAGAMVAVSEIYEGPKRDNGAVVTEASGEPDDLDRDGLDLSVGSTDVTAPPLARLDPVGDAKRKPPQL